MGQELQQEKGIEFSFDGKLSSGQKVIVEGRYFDDQPVDRNAVFTAVLSVNGKNIQHGLGGDELTSLLGQFNHQRIEDLYENLPGFDFESDADFINNELLGGHFSSDEGVSPSY